MIPMVARLSIVLSSVFFASLAGCGGTEAGKCVPGYSVACACPSGQQGAQTCNSAGTFAACVCSGPSADAGGVGGPGEVGGSDAPVATSDVDGGDAQLATVLQGVFAPTGSMTVARDDFTATLLRTGMVLIAGGYGSNLAALASVELYDPTAGTFAATGSMAAARTGHTATLLPSGQLLIVGGTPDDSTALASAELYDPAAGTFTATGSLSTARWNHTATLLPDGTVLIAGGENEPDGATSPEPLASTELYDPGAGTFTATGSLTVARDDFTATLLGERDGTRCWRRKVAIPARSCTIRRAEPSRPPAA